MDSAQRRPAGLGVAALSFRGGSRLKPRGPEPAPPGVPEARPLWGSRGLLRSFHFSRSLSTDSGSWTLSWEVDGKSLSSTGWFTGGKNVPYSVTRSDTGVRLGLRWMLGTHLGNNAQSSRSEKWHESIKIQRLLFPVNVRKQVWPESPWATTDRAGKAAEGRPSAGSACGVRGV